jgi:uncharacterized protein DUF4154
MDLLRRRVAVIAALLVASASAGAAPLAVNASENDLKAAFIYNFAKFVEWPVAAATDPLTIDVIDDDPLVAALKRTVEGKRAQGRPIVVRAQTAGSEPPDGDIAVIAAASDGQVAWHLDRLKRRPVLTIGDSPRFLQLGGMIQFRRVDSRLQFDINPRAASERGLRISAKLIVLAREKVGG